jgi:hypothetical protein
VTRNNPNSSIRSGYAYEDLYILQLCMEWLSEPEKFKGIRIQYVPDGTKGFAIDDVVAEFKDGSQSFYQLKYKQNPTVDLWDFKHLLDKGLLRWIASYGMLTNAVPFQCSMITNGQPADEILTCSSGERIDLSKIAMHFPDVGQLLSEKFSTILLEDFFANFNFIFGQPDKHELEEKLRAKLYEDLKVTKAGVDSLLLFIGKEGSEKHPREITLSGIRNHLSWDNPRPLNQNFIVPTDFEFFNQRTHHQILDDLRDPKGGTKVFIGKPGAGKSTYLSKLYETLKHEHIAVFRHHYHLNPNDQSQFERLNTDRVKEALRAAFKKEKSTVLKELSRENTEHTPLREFISKIASHYSKRGKSFVLIVDGLDHVIREGNSEDQLREFITEVFHPQKGFWLLLGTQEMAVKCLPAGVFKSCPEDTWIEIKGLSRTNVAKIVKAAIKSPEHRKDKDGQRVLTNKIFEITKGNPLHLRYVLGEISNSEEYISTYDLERIPPYKGDIKIYYQDIWRNLSDLAKTLCFSITALDFKLHKEQLIDLSGYLTPYPSQITSCFKEIAHLIVTELSGISVYHNSFMVFMSEQPELKQQQLILYKSIRNWLNTCNDESLKWSELSKIEYYLGNSDPILSIDKEWIIQSYLQCREENQIQNLIDLATRAAFEAKNFKKSIFYGEASLRFERRSHNLWDDNLQKIWVTSFKNNSDIFIKYPDFSVLTYYQIKELLIALKERGMINEIPEEAVDRINILFQDRNNDTGSIAKAWLEVLLHFEDSSDQRITNFIKQFRKGDRSDIYIVHYVTKILENQERFGHRLSALFKSKLTDLEKKAISEVLIEHDLRMGIFQWKRKLKTFPVEEDYNHKIYIYLSEKLLPDGAKLAERGEFSEKYDYASDNKGGKTLCIDHFFTSLLLSLKQELQPIDSWLRIKKNDKQTQLLKALLRIGKKIGTDFYQKLSITVSDVLSPLDNIDTLDFYKDHSLYELRRSVMPRIIDEVIWLAHVFNKHNGFNEELSIEEIKMLSTHPWYYQGNLFELLHTKKAKLSTEAFSYFAQQELDKLEDELIDFKDKTERMVNLAILAADLKNSETLNLLLYRAAENIIAYGNHKDMLLYDILLGMKRLINVEPEKGRRLLRQISPYVYHIDKLTDGDETGSFIYDYSSQLALADVHSLYNFYFLAISNREYYLSESLFANILSTLDFTDPISRSVAATAVGDSPYDTLKDIATKDPGALEVLTDIQSCLGDIGYERRPDENDNNSIKGNPKADEDCAKVKAEDLEEHLRIVGTASKFRKYEKSNFLLNWSKYWLVRPEADVKQIITVLKLVIQDSFAQTEHELLDFIYPFAKTVDRDFAFHCICWAHSNSGSWASDYFASPEQAHERWKKVIADFPLRKDEFFILSVNNSGMKYSKTKKKNYIFTPPKAIQFFIDSGEINKAEAIMQHYIDALPSLFPNVKLPEPEFYTMDIQIDPFDLLIKRMEWLSPIVKERAAKQLISILSNDIDGRYHVRYFAWLNGLFLESRACEGLIILLLSTQQKSSFSRKYVTKANLGGLLSLRCMATDLICGSIGYELGISFKFAQTAYAAMSFGSLSRTKDEFDELVGRNLPVVYIRHLEELQENCPFELWSCWNMLFDDYCDEHELKYKRDDETYNNDFNRVMIGRSTIFTEILRSTFFRLLDYLYSEKLIGMQEAFGYNVDNFTIEPSLWSVCLSKKPAWWPEAKNTHKLRYNHEPPQLELDLEKLLFNDGKEQLLSLHGNIPHMDNFYHSDYFYGLAILPFASSKKLDHGQNAREIFRELEINSGIWYPGVRDMRNFGTYTNELRFIPPKTTSRFGTIPLLATVKGLNINMLQYYRSFFPTMMLSQIIKGTLNLKINDGHLRYFDKAKIVGSYMDFLDGLRDSSDTPDILPYGSFFTLDKGYLSKFLSDRKLNLSFAVKKTLYTKDSSSRTSERNEKNEYLIIDFNGNCR